LALSVAALGGLGVWVVLFGVLIDAGGSGGVPMDPRRQILLGLTLVMTAGVAWATVRAYTSRIWLERTAERVHRVASKDSHLRLALAVFYGTGLMVVVAVFGVSLGMLAGHRSAFALFLDRGSRPRFASLVDLNAWALRACWSRLPRRRRRSRRGFVGAADGYW
jgi:uncharacterized BrkB/YihY/UPF0761 family membrane protein